MGRKCLKIIKKLRDVIYGLTPRISFSTLTRSVILTHTFHVIFVPKVEQGLWIISGRQKTFSNLKSKKHARKSVIFTSNLIRVYVKLVSAPRPKMFT